MNERERPKWSPRPDIVQDVVDENALLERYVQIKKQISPDFAQSVDYEIVRTLAPALRSWTVKELYTYLGDSKIWDQPSNTHAVFKEIEERLRTNGDLQPRR